MSFIQRLLPKRVMGELHMYELLTKLLMSVYTNELSASDLWWQSQSSLMSVFFGFSLYQPQLYQQSFLHSLVLLIVL